MADNLRVALELGPKGKKVVAVAPDWPGLPRYAPAASFARLESEFAPNTALNVVERYPGVGSTDFWGISFAFSDYDRQSISPEALERELSLMRASWAFFDDVRARVSPEMQKGPRGGGRDRDQIVRHALISELDFARKLALRPSPEELLTDAGLHAHRATYCQTIHDFHAQGKPARTWPLRYLIRHTAFHTLDHAWEMEDKDLTAPRS